MDLLYEFVVIRVYCCIGLLYEFVAVWDLKLGLLFWDCYCMGLLLYGLLYWFVVVWVCCGIGLLYVVCLLLYKVVVVWLYEFVVI